MDRETFKRQLVNPASLVASGGGGGKGGGGGTRAPVEDPDTAASRSEIRIKEILTEGESPGLALPGLRGVALDGTAVEDSEGNFNFTNFDFFLLPGTQDQSYIPNFDADENTQAVGVRLFNATPWVHTIADSTVDAFRVDVRFPQMVTVDTRTGDRHGATAQIKIEVQADGGGYVEIINDTVRIKVSNPYVRTYRLTLRGLGDGPYDVRVTRVTADSTTDTVQNQTWIDSYTDVTWGKLRHPNTCVVGVSISAEQFGSIPTRAYCMYGIIIKVPTNYDPITREYATTGPGTTNGGWDGTFKMAFTNNAAWCWYAAATNTRWGLGRYIDPAKVNKFALYIAGQVCDQLVPDGRGGTEPRYTCALYLQERAPAIQVMNDIASIFGAMVYYASGWLIPVQDRPAASVAHQFTLENVVDGKFQYARASKSARHTVAIVAFADMTNFGKTNYVYVEDEGEIRRTGKIIPTEVAALGCTSPGQAHRLGKWLLLTERLDKTVAFKAGQEGMFLRPGDLIETHDPYRSGKRLGGRVVSASTLSVTLDKDVDLEVGKAYWVSVIRRDGQVERRAVISGPGVRRALNVSPAFTNEPGSDTVWILVADDNAPLQWRVVHVVPKDLAVAEVTALEYDAAKFAAVDDPLVIDDDLPPGVLPGNLVAPPGIVTAVDVTVVLPQGVRQDIHVSWIRSPEQSVRRYRVSVRYNDGNWLVFDNSAEGLDTTYENAQPGLYQFAVEAINTLGIPSRPSTVNHALGIANPLEDATITGLEILGQGLDFNFTTPDVLLAWRVNSPANAGYYDPGDPNGLNGLLDPFFQAYVVTLYSEDGLTQLAPPVLHPAVNYNFTLEENQRAALANLGLDSLPYADFTIGVALLDAFNNLSPEARITLHKTPPGVPTNIRLQVGLGSADLRWDNNNDRSLAKVDLYVLGILNGVRQSAAYPATSMHVEGLINGRSYTFTLQSVDKFGLRSGYADWGTPGNVFSPPIGPPNPTDGFGIMPISAIFNDIGAVQFNPNGGDVPTGAWTLWLGLPSPNVQIRYRLDGTAPTEADLLYDPDTGIAMSGGGTVSARGYAHGYAGPSTTKTFGGVANIVTTPVFTPRPGNYMTVTGYKNIVMNCATAGASISYTTDESAPTPTHGTIIAPGAAASITGEVLIRAMAFKAGMVDSPIIDGQYLIDEAIGGL